MLVKALGSEARVHLFAEGLSDADRARGFWGDRVRYAVIDPELRGQIGRLAHAMRMLLSSLARSNGSRRPSLFTTIGVSRMARSNVENRRLH